MKAGSELVWLSGDIRVLLRRLKAESGVSISGLICECVCAQLKNVSPECLAEAVLLKFELFQLDAELRMVRRLQNAILCNGPYLRDYAHDLMKGAFKTPSSADVRKSLLTYPGADRLLPALEALCGRRHEIHVRLCEISQKLYPDVKYPLLGELKDEFQGKRVAPLRRWEGPDQKEFRKELDRWRSRRRDRNHFEGGEDSGSYT